MDKKTGIIIRGFDIFDISKYIVRLNKRQQAITLTNLEVIIDKNSKEFSEIRKLILDSTNDFTRSLIKFVFGDIEIE